MTINQTTANVGGVVPQPVVPAAPVANAPAAPAPAVQVPAATTPAVPQDENKTAPATTTAAPDVAIDQVNLDMKELQVLDQLFEQFIGDGELSQSEMKMFQELRGMLAQPKAGAADSTKAGAADPTGGAAGDPVGGSGPNSPSWDHGQAVTDGRSFSSVGDPHETTGDGGKFDNMKEGGFVKARSATGDFELQTVQGKDKSGRWPGATVNHAAAVKAGKDTVAYNGLTQTLTINGQPKTLAEGENFKLPDGGSVTKTKEGLAITSPAGDKVNIAQRDNYIDVSGEIGPNRKDGEVRGSLGNFDADKDAANDLVGRDGKVMGDPKDKAAVDKFVEDWRTKPEENLFGNDPIGGTGPGTGDTAEVKGDKEAFDKLDANDDNVIDGNELKPDVAKYDISKDGKVDLMEFLKGRDGDRKAQAPEGGAAAQAPAGGAAQAPAGGAAQAPAGAEPEAQNGKARAPGQLKKKLQLLDTIRNLFLADGNWSPKEQQLYTDLRKLLMGPAQPKPPAPQPPVAGGPAPAPAPQPPVEGGPAPAPAPQPPVVAPEVEVNPEMDGTDELDIENGTDPTEQPEGAVELPEIETTITPPAEPVITN